MKLTIKFNIDPDELRRGVAKRDDFVTPWTGSVPNVGEYLNLDECLWRIIRKEIKVDSVFLGDVFLVVE